LPLIASLINVSDRLELPPSLGAADLEATLQAHGLGEGTVLMTSRIVDTGAIADTWRMHASGQTTHAAPPVGGTDGEIGARSLSSLELVAIVIACVVIPRVMSPSSRSPYARPEAQQCTMGRGHSWHGPWNQEAGAVVPKPPGMAAGRQHGLNGNGKGITD